MPDPSIESLIEETKQYVKYWEQLAELAKLQKRALGHWQGMFGWPSFASFLPSLAPTNLSQPINPWNISLFQVVRETRGHAQTEVDILTEVAGYGSQLGTVIDALLTLLPKDEAARRALGEEGLCAVMRLEQLARDIEEVKKR